MLDVVPVPALADNYVWLVHHSGSGETVAIDPAVAGPVLKEAERRGWRLTQIWNTHWHADHTGGNLDVKAATGCTIAGPAAEAERIPGIDRRLVEGDKVALGTLAADVLEMPAHTAGHIAFHLPDARAIFVGDVLFAMGCGRLFEGSAGQMHANLQRLALLPADTLVYCAHEYTLGNARFALTAEPGNTALAERAARVEAARAAGKATVPFTIGEERDTNPFMRASSAEAFAELRQAKDHFRG